MPEETINVRLIRTDAGTWRVFIDETDEGMAFQFPWDALQCALNGSLNGKPATGLQTITIRGTKAIDHVRVANIRMAEEEQRTLLSSLRGIDGDGI